MVRFAGARQSSGMMPRAGESGQVRLCKSLAGVAAIIVIGTSRMWHPIILHFAFACGAEPT
jgi:hypothetical protein